MIFTMWPSVTTGDLAKRNDVDHNLRKVKLILKSRHVNRSIHLDVIEVASLLRKIMSRKEHLRKRH